MGWGAVVLAILQIIIKIWDAIHEVNVETKKQKTVALQSGVRAIIDKDASRLSISILELERLSK